MLKRDIPSYLDGCPSYKYQPQNLRQSCFEIEEETVSVIYNSLSLLLVITTLSCSIVFVDMTPRDVSCGVQRECADIRISACVSHHMVANNRLAYSQKNTVGRV